MLAKHVSKKASLLYNMKIFMLWVEFTSRVEKTCRDKYVTINLNNDIVL